MYDIHQLPSSVATHCWNANRTELAVASENLIHIYKFTPSGFVHSFTLKEHQDQVTGLSWSSSNRIVSCSSDRNAYVWTFDGEWKPTLVLLRIGKGARCVAWNSQENKFVVGSVGVAAVCWFDEENNWWVSKHIKVKGTVLSIDWHPAGVIFACGSTDGKTRVLSGFVKGIDKKAGDPVWGDKLPIGQILGEFNAESWVHAVAFSPSGNAVAFASHSSTLSIVSPSLNYYTNVKTPYLPILSLLFISDNQILGVGNDLIPFLFVYSGAWQFSHKIDISQKKQTANTAMNKFKQMDSKGQSESEESSALHQTSINCLEPFAYSGPNVIKFSTSGLDGKLVIWDALALGLANLRM